MHITINLDQQLIDHGISISELSDRVGVSSSDLCLLKRIKIRDLRFSIIENICRELNCKLTDLIKFCCDEPLSQL